MSIESKFKKFCSNLTIQNRTKISERYKGITRRLNLEYWDWDNETSFSKYVGSYGRGTAIRYSSDMDMIFQMPTSVKSRFDNHTGNGQSALLQEVKNKIIKTYWNTDIGGDGQVIVVKFSDGMKFEVVPAFENSNDSFTYPDSNSGGMWKITNPVPEIESVSNLDILTNGNMKRLCKMTRAWKVNCYAPIGGLLIDTLAYRFLSTWEYKENGYLYYDWMVRDFFKYMSEQDPTKSFWYALGSNQKVYRRGKFEAKAKKAYKSVIEAMELESKDYEYSANKKWKEIFGSSFI